MFIYQTRWYKSENWVATRDWRSYLVELSLIYRIVVTQLRGLQLNSTQLVYIQTP